MEPEGLLPSAQEPASIQVYSLCLKHFYMWITFDEIQTEIMSDSAMLPIVQ
jgi:hypothetical protein